MLTVHLCVNDAGTQKPTPVRVRITDPEGTYYPPLGRLARNNDQPFQDGNLFLDGKAHAYIDGTCEIRLPAGPLDVDIRKGPEYKPIRERIQLTPGKIALRFTIERWTDLRALGWHSGETQCLDLSPHGALLAGAGEDLAVVNLLALEKRESRYNAETGEHTSWSSGFPNLVAFSGQQPALEMPGHMVVVNTFNNLNTLGSLRLLNCHRVVFPLTAGLDWTLEDWCQQCHRKGGLVMWPTPHGVRLPNRVHGEGLAQILLGNVDAIDLNPTFPHIWYGLLNLGYRIPLTHSGYLGQWRTYAHVTGDFGYKPWIEAVRSGRVFATSGPILLMSVDGQPPGSVLSDRDAVTVSVTVQGQTPFDVVDLVANGKVIERKEWPEEVTSAEFKCRLPIARSTWIAAACRKKTGGTRRAHVLAHTSAVFVDRGPKLADDALLAPWLKYLDAMIDWARKEEGMPSDKQREQFVHIFEEARKRLLRSEEGALQ